MDQEYRESLSLNVSKFLDGLKQAEQALKGFVQNGKSQINAMAKEFDRIKDGVIQTAKALGVLTAGPAAIIALTKAAGESAEELEHLHIQTGLNAQQAQLLDVAMRRVGMGASDLGFMFRILSANVIEARDRSSEAARMFDALGVSQRVLASGDTNAILAEMARNMGDIQAGTDKADIAVKLLGRSGLTFLPALQQDLRKAADDAIRFGTLADNQIAQLTRMDDAFDDLGTALKKAKDLFGAQFAPSIEQALIALTDLVVMIKNVATGAVGTVLTGIAQGWSAIFVGFVGLLKEVRVNLWALGQAMDAVFSGKMSELPARLSYIAEVAGESIAKIEAETEGRLNNIFNPKGVDDEGKKRKVTVPDDPSKGRDAAVKALEAARKLREAEIDSQKQAALDAAAFEKVQIQERVALREISAIKVAELEAKANANDLRAKVAANNALVQADADYFQKRLKIGFKVNEEGKAEEQAFRAEFDALQATRNKDAATLQAQIRRQGLQDTIKILQAEEAAEKAKGTQAVESKSSEYKVSRDLKLRELSDTLAVKQAEVDAGESEFASFEELARRRREVLEAQMALELEQADTNENQKLAIHRKYSAQIERERRRESGGMLEGLREGLHRYVNDTGSMFGMAVDMARQTAQAMTQAFKTFFFDLFEGRVQGIKDVLRGFLNFVKEVMSQVAAQLATAAVLRGIVSFFGAGAGPGAAGSVDSASAGVTANQGGQIVRRYAMGGPVFSNGDSVPALLTPGEFVVSRRGVDVLNRMNQGQNPFGGEGAKVTVNVNNAPPGTKADVNVRRVMEEMVVDIVLRNVAQNGPMRQLMQGA